MILSDKHGDDKSDAEELKRTGEEKGAQSEIDHAGTDPNRYRSVATGDSHTESGDDEYNKKPKNHTSPDERMINPDRGE